MKAVSLLEIRKKANALSKSGKKWHFHILTPGCVFNKEKKFALVLENSSGGETLVNYSDTKQEREGKVLLELLHGIKADEPLKQVMNASETTGEMVKRAEELTKKHIPWHHHALFPECIFNKSKGKWVVMLEDPETKKIVESVTDYKPEEDLQLIEPLFYKQRK